MADRDRRKVYLNADRTKEVPAGSPDAAFIFDADEAQRILKDSATAEKAQQPAANKAVTSSANKGR